MQQISFLGILLLKVKRCDGANQNPWMDADFVCKIRMQIYRTIKISTSCYNYCEST